MAYISCHFFAETLGVSTSMQVLLPQATGTGQIGMGGSVEKSSYPVLYLLHGWSDDDTIWMRRTSIERYAADRGLVVVMPRVELSFYQNMVSGMRFWDFLTGELPQLVGRWFPASPRREDTFAAGLSMGGYGAFRLGLAFPERFAAVASLSGALDLSGKHDDWRHDPGRRPKLEAIWGSDFSAWTPEMNLLDLATELTASNRPRAQFYQWCGTEDFLYSQNKAFRKHAEAVGLDLTYREGPGDHTWGNWDREIQAVLDWLPIS